MCLYEICEKMLWIVVNKVANKEERMPEKWHGIVETMLTRPVMIVHKVIMNLLITGLSTMNGKLKIRW